MCKMKSSVKKDLGYSIPYYSLHDMENEVEIASHIEAAKVLLKPCPCCGGLHLVVDYTFTTEDTPCLVGVVQPHMLTARCTDCGIRSKTWYAEDDEADFKEALRLLIEAWNRRPE